MKTILGVLIAFFITGSAMSQIDSLKVISDSTVKIDNIYAGVLANSFFGQDKLSFSKSVNGRIGFQATYSPNKWLSLTAREMYQVDDQSQSISSSLFWVKFRVKSITMETGYLPTLATETRPISVSVDGHLENWSEAIIVGTALGTKIKYNFKNSYIGAGIALRNDKPEYHLRYADNILQASVYYSEFNDCLGSAISAKVDRLKTVTSFNSGKNLGQLVYFNLDRKHKIDVYIDAGYGFPDNKIIRAETGFLKGFSGTYLNGVFGLAYCHETRTVNGYFLVFI